MVQITEYRPRTETPGGVADDNALRFGNPVAEAWMNLGAEAGEAGARARNFLEHEAADKARSAFSDQLHKLKWGDPATGSRGLMTLSGEAAEAELATYGQKVAEIRREVERGLPKGHAAYYFHGAADDEERALRGELSRFAAQNLLNMQAERSKVRIDNENDGYGLAKDEATRNLHLEASRRETEDQIRRDGHDPQSEVGRARMQAAEAQTFRAFAAHHSKQEALDLLRSGQLKLSEADRDILRRELETLVPAEAMKDPFGGAPPKEVSEKFGSPGPAAPAAQAGGAPAPAPAPSAAKARVGPARPPAAAPPPQAGVWGRCATTRTACRCARMSCGARA